jgi:hypothetical protein
VHENRLATHHRRIHDRAATASFTGLDGRCFATCDLAAVRGSGSAGAHEYSHGPAISQDCGRQASPALRLTPHAGLSDAWALQGGGAVCPNCRLTVHAASEQAALASGAAPENIAVFFM